MKLIIDRTYLVNRTEGILTVNDDLFRCDTLERAWRIADHPCIPEGTYPIVFYPSPKNKCLVPLLENVPGRSMIEIHPANATSELLGCIAPGKRLGELVSNSRNTFKKLMVHLLRAKANDEYIEITIRKAK